MTNLSDSSAVHVARRLLIELDAADNDAYRPGEIGIWLGRLERALRGVLDEIDDAEGRTS